MGQPALRSTTTSYNAASQVTSIAIGTSTDTDYDGYTYDPNTGRMTGWTFQVGSTPATQAGALTWNANGTLNNVAITDQFYSGASQTCYFNPSSGSGMGYDDLGRLLNDNCGSVWAQTFSYDQYDNITKSGSLTWNPGYSASTNQYTLAGTSYDANGDVTNDSFNAYAYNEFGKTKSINASGTNCASGGECVVYDALGRAVEIDSGSTSTEVWYTQLGKTAYMNGTTYSYAYWPTPGGATLLDQTGGFYRFLHKDWLGNARVSSSVGGQNIIDDRAFAPYGEMYNNFGSTSANENMFTGDTQDIMATGNCCYDTPNRELSGSQGRWLSPDPAGAGWNLYAYGTNPNSSVDPSGLVGFFWPSGNYPPSAGTDELFGIPIDANTLNTYAGVQADVSSTAASLSPPTISGDDALSEEMARASVVQTYLSLIGSSSPLAHSDLPLIDESLQEGALIVAGIGLLKTALSLAEEGWNALFSNAADAVPASGFQTLAGYNLAGSWEMVGDTYTMHISVITATADAQGMDVLSNAIVAQAQSAGASNIAITGNMVTRTGFMTQSYWESLGWTYEQIDSSTILLTMQVH